MVDPSGNERIDGLLDGSEWSVDTLSYSNPRWRSDYGSSYVSDENDNGRSAQDEWFSRLSPDQLVVVQSALDTDWLGAVPALAGFAVEGFTLLNFDCVGPKGRAALRFANTGDAETAYASPPGHTYAGDVWFGEAGRFPAVGNYDLATILHEIGHALGLKHPHETGFLGHVPQSYDSLEFSIMSYRSFVGADPESGGYENGYWDYPQSFMMLDIAALQHMYGANFAVNSDDTVYAWSPYGGETSVNGEVALPAVANRIFATIWDGGGEDTYDLSAYWRDLRLDLRAGHASVFSEHQQAELGGGPNHGLARGNIFNALRYEGDSRSLIENAVGGSGDDRILGNDADNRLNGGGGHDTLRGFAGRDMLCGGKAADTFLFRSIAELAPGRPGYHRRGRRCACLPAGGSRRRRRDRSERDRRERAP